MTDEPVDRYNVNGIDVELRTVSMSVGMESRIASTVIIGYAALDDQPVNVRRWARFELTLSPFGARLGFAYAPHMRDLLKVRIQVAVKHSMRQWLTTSDVIPERFRNAYFNNALPHLDPNKIDGMTACDPDVTPEG